MTDSSKTIVFFTSGTCSFGTTHADYFYGAIPCARNLTAAEIHEDYETNTGKVIVETFQSRKINPAYVPGVICRSHGPFDWGKDAVVLEEAARMDLFTEIINPHAGPVPQCVFDKHFSRKHGPQRLLRSGQAGCGGFARPRLDLAGHMQKETGVLFCFISFAPVLLLYHAFQTGGIKSVVP